MFRSRKQTDRAHKFFLPVNQVFSDRAFNSRAALLVKVSTHN